MATAAFDAPTSDFSRIKDLLTRHNATYVHSKGGGGGAPAAPVSSTAKASPAANIRSAP
jgi:hypothetical protein